MSTNKYIKLEKEFVDFLKDVTTVAKLTTVDSFVVHNGKDGKPMVRGESSINKGIFILETDNVPKLTQFNGIAVSRVDILHRRLNVFNDYSVTFLLKEKDNGDKIVRRLKIKKNRSSVDFTCAEPHIIKAPSKMNQPFSIELMLDKETVDLIKKSGSIISSKNMTFSKEKDSDKVKMIFLDEDQDDKLEHEIQSKVNNIKDDLPKFVFSYKTKALQPMFIELCKENDEFLIQFTKSGIISFVFRGITVYVFSEVE